MELIKDGLCPADLILKEWNKNKQNINSLINYVKIK